MAPRRACRRVGGGASRRRIRRGVDPFRAAAQQCGAHLVSELPAPGDVRNWRRLASRRAVGSAPTTASSMWPACAAGSRRPGAATSEPDPAASVSPLWGGVVDRISALPPKPCFARNSRRRDPCRHRSTGRRGRCRRRQSPQVRAVFRARAPSSPRRGVGDPRICYLLARHLGSSAEAAFLRAFPDELVLQDVTVSDLRRSADLVEQYRDLSLGMVDASLVAVAERLELRTVATLDRRPFSVVRPRHVTAFELVP